MSQRLMLISGVAAAAIGGLWLWAFSEEEATAPPPNSETATQTKRTDTVADAWRWNNFADTSTAGATSKEDKPLPTTAMNAGVVKIYRFLQSVKLDEQGRVVADQTLKEALEEGFDSLGPNLTAKELSDIQHSIRIGLPGPAGDGAALILGNYYQFRLAEAELNRSVGPSSAVDRHQELVQLRRNFLGAETAEKLFAVEDTQASHMFAAIEIQRDPKLTTEEKRAKQAALQEQLQDRQLASGQLRAEEAAAEKVRRLRDQNASSVDIYSARRSILGAERARELAEVDREEAEWQSSFNGFWQARRYVMESDLDETERARRIEQLLDQYFSSDERERARVTSFDWQERESK